MMLLAAGPAAAQGQAGPPTPPGATGAADPATTPAPMPYRGGVLPPPRTVVPDHAFAPLRPEPGDIWSEVRGWSSPEARRNASGAAPGPERPARPGAGRQPADAAASDASGVSPARAETAAQRGRRGRGADQPGPEAPAQAQTPAGHVAPRVAAAGHASVPARGAPAQMPAPAGAPGDATAHPAATRPASAARAVAVVPTRGTAAASAPGVTAQPEKPRPEKARPEKPAAGTGAR